ncbi:MAG: 1,4-alpha-glucan branching protein GlgB [Gammaproteobacteria bacterium]|nr:1,4-alpha-glucan branching protein GlgB [Gammaproteobacteria bacterium]NIT64241.1 1,4-alpha-glucan branching protein GlgB [Gammaproteobacteria bacterium]NIV52652.1 1,4-alpha-glucan branching protein GlgB [Gammaproteobacteria bacterium]NIY32821.1 1,4-alpha-glucan branching protein GlgB [Gammaproteobacteria bacterium]
MNDAVRHDVTLLTEHDIYLFREGTHCRLSERLGAHPVDGGVLFAVWAPNARGVSVIGDFNGWDAGAHPLHARDDGSGIWEGLVPGIGLGALYKYHVRSRVEDYAAARGDPFALRREPTPHTASIVWDLGYEWNDGPWMERRHARNAPQAPLAIYEVHPASWRRVPEQGNRALSYRELGEQLADYLHHMGYTHVQLMPVMEHCLDDPWGYQTTGYFAPAERYGSPQDLMYLVELLHQREIGVILDWVPSHFSGDGQGLSYFDGTYLFEDVRRSRPGRAGRVFDYARNEVRAFLISSACFWLRCYHVDGLRIGCVASMLHDLNACEESGRAPVHHGGSEDPRAIAFLKNLNEAICRELPDVQTIAGETADRPMVSRPTEVGGLGFGMKWNTRWARDTLSYFSLDPLHRAYHHDRITAGIEHAFSESFMLALSHGEVGRGKGSLLAKMPGDDWQKMAGLRCLLGYTYAYPGKKLLFMGGEFGQWNEWRHDASLDWHLMDYASHRGVATWVRDLNHLYRSEIALHELDFQREGFEWMDFHDWQNSVISFTRAARSGDDVIMAVCNFTPVPRFNYVVPVPRGGWWREMLNSDAARYGGSGTGNFGGVEAAPVGAGAQYYSLSLQLPPLGVVFFKDEMQP